jgi:hypothetical protein
MVSIKYTVIEKYGTKFSMYSGPCMLRGGALAAGDTCGGRFMPSNHASNAPDAARQILSNCRIIKWEKLIFIPSFIYILY